MLYNRDLSWLGFNLRVLQEAADPSVPLFERIRFLSIFSSNLDEFFRVRYPLMFAVSRLKPKTQMKAGVGMADDMPAAMQQEITRQQRYFGAILENELIPALQKENICFYYKQHVLPHHTYEVRELFLSTVLSFIQPIWLGGGGSSQFFPENNRLYFIVSVKESPHNTIRHAVVNIPSHRVPRFFVLSSIQQQQYVIMVDDVIRENLDCIFPGLDIAGVYSIKFNRDAELHLDDEYSDDLLEKIEKQVRKRDIGAPSRFLFEPGMPRNLQLYLAAVFNLKFEEMYEGGRYHNLSDLSAFPTFGKPLHYAHRPPIPLLEFLECGDIFKVITRRDVLLHFPYHSYNPVLSFFNQAAIDPHVTSIYITLYRVAADSHIANALISAAKNGKQVTVFIELKARFDEANNIRWSREMEEAGIQLVYSLPQIKVHSKIALVTKSEGDTEKNFALVSTGNFNESTARFYTDHLLMTTNRDMVQELVQLFKYLQKQHSVGLKQKTSFKKLLVSQFNMVERFVECINHQIDKAARGEPALIRIKVNNLEESGMIDQLYAASQAGVQVQLCVRSVCCLTPGVPGLSENIVVRRLVDRYLEHSRLFIFGAGNDKEVYMGSADWMTRNLHHRIEVCVPIDNGQLARELEHYFELQWNDNTKAVQLSPTLEMNRQAAGNGPSVNAQHEIYEYLKQRQ